MLKHYLGQLEIRHGEYEFTYTLKFRTTGEPYKYLNSIARGFYGEPDEAQDADSTGYYFNCGEVFVEAGGIQELSQATFDELTLLTEL